MLFFFILFQGKKNRVLIIITLSRSSSKGNSFDEERDGKGKSYTEQTCKNKYRRASPVSLILLPLNSFQLPCASSSSFSFSLESCYNCPSSTRKRSIKTQIKLKNPSQTLRHTIEWRICGSIVPHLCDCISYLLLNLPFSTKHSIQRRICASIPNLVVFQEQILQLPHLPMFF